MKQVSFRESHSGLLRLWHWASVIVTGLLLFTVFVSKTFLNVFHTKDSILHSLTGSGVKLTQEQAWGAALALRDYVWQWHTRFGFVLAGLFGFRLLIEVLQLKEERFFTRIRRALAQLRRKEMVPQAKHYFIVKMIYLLFYGLLATIVFTGLWMNNNIQLKETAAERFHSVKEIHENAFLFLLLFIFLHLVGLIRAERGKYKDVVSDMINGGKAQQ